MTLPDFAAKYMNPDRMLQVARGRMTDKGFEWHLQPEFLIGETIVIQAPDRFIAPIGDGGPSYKFIRSDSQFSS